MAKGTTATEKETKTNSAAKNEEKPKAEKKVNWAKEIENIKLDEMITIKNLAPWDVTFNRLHDLGGGIVISPNGFQKLSRNEVIAQINSGNRLLGGIDSYGSHATIYIDDELTRRYVDFDEDDRKQLIINNETVKALFDSKVKMGDFEKEIKNLVKCSYEKFALIDIIRELGVNDFRKIRFAEEYTGCRI